MRRSLTFLALGVGAQWLLAVAAPAAIIETASTVHTAEVVRVDRDSVAIKLPMGEISISKSEILNIVIEKPKVYDDAVKLLNDKKYKEAAAVFKPLAERYAGLDIDWIEDSVLRLADAQAGSGDFLSAKRTLETYKLLYPKSPRQVEVAAKANRVLVGQKKYKEARDALQKFVEPLLNKVSITESEESAAAESLGLLGDCQKALNEPEDALDSYLTIVTLFDVNVSLTAEAKYKAAQIFDDLKKWDRAKMSYKELLSTEFGDEAKKRLAALEQAHP